MGRGDEKDPGKPGRGAAMLGRMQRTNKERPFLQDGEGAIVGVGPWLRHSVELLLCTQTNTRQRLVFAGTELTYVDGCGGILYWLLLSWDMFYTRGTCGFRKWSQRKKNHLICHPRLPRLLRYANTQVHSWDCGLSQVWWWKRPLWGSRGLLQGGRIFRHHSRFRGYGKLQVCMMSCDAG